MKKRGKKSEKKASVIHRYEGPWQLGNGKKVWLKLILTMIEGGKRNNEVSKGQFLRVMESH